MDKVRGNINGFSFATSPCPCRGADHKIAPVVQLAAHAKSSTLYDRSYGRTSKFFRLDGLLLFCIIMGLRSASSDMIIFRENFSIFFPWTRNEGNGRKL